jgi:hypothetical protein
MLTGLLGMPSTNVGKHPLGFPMKFYLEKQKKAFVQLMTNNVTTQRGVVEILQDAYLKMFLIEGWAMNKHGKESLDYKAKIVDSLTM